MLFRPGEGRDLLHHGGEAADLADAEEADESSADDEDDAGRDVGHHHRPKPARSGVEAHEHRSDDDREPERPAEEPFEHGGGAHQNRRDRPHHEERPDDGEKRPHRSVVPAAQILGNGVDVGSPEEGHEEERGEQQRQGAADEVEVHHHDAVAVRIAGEPDHVLGADVGNDERHPRRPPGKRLAREKIVAARVDAPARPEPETGDDGEIENDERDIERREVNRRHGGGNDTLPSLPRPHFFQQV